MGQSVFRTGLNPFAENTIVFYSTDNGPHDNTWPSFVGRRPIAA